MAKPNYFVLNTSIFFLEYKKHHKQITTGMLSEWLLRDVKEAKELPCCLDAYKWNYLITKESYKGWESGMFRIKTMEWDGNMVTCQNVFLCVKTYREGPARAYK